MLTAAFSATLEAINHPMTFGGIAAGVFLLVAWRLARPGVRPPSDGEAQAPTTSRPLPVDSDADTVDSRFAAPRPRDKGREGAPVAKPLSPGEIRDLETADLARAALAWQQLGKWDEAARCLAAGGEIGRAAIILQGLHRDQQAVLLLQDQLRRQPADETVRLRLIESLLNLRRTDEARELVESMVADGENPIKVSARFFECAARDFESMSRLDDAERYYKLAQERDNSIPELTTRLLFIRQIRRLNDGKNDSTGESSPARRFLQQVARESSVFPTSYAKTTQPPFEPDSHEIIVGHLAMGFEKPEPHQSVGSIYSLSRRFVLESMLNESKRAAVFQARDRLLDFPVALKLYRLPSDCGSLEPLRQRLMAIARLNHPNLAKITFVDREGSILRVATEYLPGGNLREFLRRMGGVGIPLIVRMGVHVCSALHASHSRGVPHGDVRPENMIIGPDQRIKLLDFAMAPIPVQIPIDPEMDSGGIELADPNAELTVTQERIQSDIIQFGEVLAFMLQNARRSADPNAAAKLETASDEMNELIEGIRSGRFTSILRLGQILQQIFERSVPSSKMDNPKL